ncbi:MAG: BON domain-containing protein [Xanthomonadales bacterium]|nr:BON domain-containing protein [Xanthomonadales bacterium]
MPRATELTRFTTLLNGAAGAASVVMAALLLQGCAAAVVGGVAVGTAAHDRRGVGTVVDDRRITLSATRSLRHDDGPARGNHIKVTTYRGTVLLTGEARETTDRQEAASLVSEVEGVQRVVNEIAVTRPSGFFRRTGDALLTARVKSSLLKIDLPDFDPTRVKVVSVRRNVYLMGWVSRAEAEAAADRASMVRGVDQVVKVFEYID